MHVTYRTKLPTDDQWITDKATALWGSIEIISKNHTYNLLQLENIIAADDMNKPLGWITYNIHNTECEIVGLYSGKERQGIGTTLMTHVIETAKKQGCHTVWLMTTNDNTQALRFYQKQGFVIRSIQINAITKQRTRKPIPLIGNDGIPIRDEIELARNI